MTHRIQAYRAQESLRAQSSWTRLSRWMGCVRPVDRPLLSSQAYHARAEEHYARGLEGEALARAWLDRRVTSPALAFENVPSPAKRGDCDIVLLSRYGMTVYEIKHWYGNYTVYPDRWMTTNARGYPIVSRKNPGWQIMANVRDMRQWLTATPWRNMPVWGIVFWAHPHASITIRGKLDYAIVQPRWWYGEKKALGVRRSQRPLLSDDEYTQAAAFFRASLPTE